MKSTQILYPLEGELDKSEVELHKENWKLIQKQLNDMKEGNNISFDRLLANLKVTENNYVLAIRSSLFSPTIFLKRQPNELRINNYNPACLAAWRANMDIQFVLNVYACAMYIVSYISKAHKGISKLLQRACDEARKGNSNIKQQVRDIGNRFLNNVEISAQEVTANESVSLKPITFPMVNLSNQCFFHFIYFIIILLITVYNNGPGCLGRLVVTWH